MKYKLINKQTNEEYICSKVVISGFDHYVSDNNEQVVLNKLYYEFDNTIPIYSFTEDTLPNQYYLPQVIATNNPSIDLPKVVDEVEELALQTFLFPKDLFYELKHSSQNDYLLEEQFGLNNLIRYREVLGFITGYNKSQESHPFGEEDMIEFLNFHQRTALLSFTSTGENQGKTYKELLQIWKEQSIKTIYYN